MAHLDLRKCNAKKHCVQNSGNVEAQCVPRTNAHHWNLAKIIYKNFEPGSDGVVHPVRRQPDAVREKIIK